MPEVVEVPLIFTECPCCSGSGSGSQLCSCKKFDSLGQNVSFFAACEGFPVYDDCKKEFIVTIRFDFSQCGSSGFGSCGSAASGPETGLDGPATGTGSECPQDCPGCCDFFPDYVEIPVRCSCLIRPPGQNFLSYCFLISHSLWNPSAACKAALKGSGSGSCVGYRPNGCAWFLLGQYALERGVFIPFDGLGMFGDIESFNIDSCEPFLASGTIDFFFSPVQAFHDNFAGLSSCFLECANITQFINYSSTLKCIRGTYTITEASSGGGGGGGGGGGPIL